MIISIAVSSRHRENGIGKALMSHCLNASIDEFTHDAGIRIDKTEHRTVLDSTRAFDRNKDLTHEKIISLNVKVSNIKAIALYEQLGFTKDKRVPNYYISPTVEDSFLMIWKASERKEKYQTKSKINLLKT